MYGRDGCAVSGGGGRGIVGGGKGDGEGGRGGETTAFEREWPGALFSGAGLADGALRL